RCWGRNNNGQLGQGNTDNMGDAAGEVASLKKVDLGGNRTAVKLALGSAHTCALLDNGELKCWGLNVDGQLGVGDTENRGDGANEMGVDLPSVDVGSGWTVVEVAAGDLHTCARLENGAARAVKCWGDNFYGQLGVGDKIYRGGAGTMGDSLLAVQLGTNRSALALALGGRHSCALLDDQSVKCWGRNDDGQLGQGNTDDRGDGDGAMGDSLPAVELGTGRTVKQLAAGSDHNCALFDDGQLKCWGKNEVGVGRLGLGDTGNRGDGANEMNATLPSVDVGSGWTVVEVAAGSSHTCARLENGTALAVKCWGNNGYGELGISSTGSRGTFKTHMGDSLPAVQLGTNRSAVALALNYYYSCALLDDASVKCWGLNDYGELGFDEGSLGQYDYRGDEEGEMGDSLPKVALCPGACPAGYTGADGATCTACKAGAYKATQGSANCTACPLNKTSLAGSTELADCKCDAGYTAASDGVPCDACEAGKFKSAVGTAACAPCLAGTYTATAGAGTCAVCPSNTVSTAESNELAGCTCAAGYTAA
ncbi:regulator of chromosome condensation 1/beta-lactamase-inhibitor protein II, partial [Baffinella frigidus]